MRLAYTLLAYLLAPAMVVNWLVRGWRERAYWSHWPERYGYGPAVAGPCLWVHAVSAGEVQASLPLVTQLREQVPELGLLVTTGTPAGRARARALYPSATVRYAPVDLPGAVRRFYARHSPAVAVILETELWPHLYRAASRRRVPVVLASARLSERSVGRYRRFIGLSRRVLEGVSVCAQTAEDARRFVQIGADPERVRVTGNLKFDYAPAQEVLRVARDWRERIGMSRPVWVAGSTHPVEEDAVLAAHATLRRRWPDALLVLVPRHPPRFGAVEESLGAHGWATAVRRGPGPLPSTDAAAVLLIATLGELESAYAAGDVAYVGGTLVPVGGHNLLEPAAAGRPVLFGPSCATAREMAAILLASGGGTLVQDAGELAARVATYFDDPQARARDGAAAAQAVAANRGAAQRVAREIVPYLQTAPAR